MPLEEPNAEFTLKGNYPYDDHATAELKISEPVEYCVDWAVPHGATSIEVSIDGQPQQLQTLPSGYYRLQRTWTPGEVIRIAFEFPLRAHFQTGRDGVRWVAFTRGPLVLAQDITSQKDQPQFVVPVKQETDDAREWLEEPEQLKKWHAHLRPLLGDVPIFRLKGGREILLAPYFLAGSNGGGSRTFFPTVPVEERVTSSIAGGNSLPANRAEQADGSQATHLLLNVVLRNGKAFMLVVTAFRWRLSGSKCPCSLEARSPGRSP